MTRTDKLAIAVVSTLMLWMSTLQPVQAVRYKITDLGTMGGSYSEAYAINDSGCVVGAYDRSSYPNICAFLWTPQGGMVDVGRSSTLGCTAEYSARKLNDAGQIMGGAIFGYDGSFSYRREPDGTWTFPDATLSHHLWATDINSAGTMVGGTLSSGPRHAISYATQTGIVDLHPRSFSASESGATCINDSGLISGYIGYADGHTRAAIWKPGADPILLPTLGVASSDVTDMNNAGQVLGWAATRTAYKHAFLWSEATGIVDLGALASGESEGVAVNAAGQVAGISDASSSYSPHAVFWGTDHKLVDLGTLGGKTSHAKGLNNSGLVVGESDISTTGYYQHAFAWTAQDGMIDLGTLGGDWSSATAVNDSGWIVGYAETSTHQTHAVLWTPVPEPSSILGVVMGLNSAIGVLAFRRRR